jgi:hypothetical protein
MRKLSTIAFCALGALAFPTAWAVTNFGGNTAPAGAHYSQGSSEPTCSVSGLTVSCTGTSIGGVGNTDADLVLSASYSATVQCRNRGGQIVDVKTQFTTSSSSDSDTRVRNGTLTVSPISLTGPSDASFTSRATCPNGNWTKVLVEGSPSLTAFSYTLTFEGYLEPAITVTGP